MFEFKEENAFWNKSIDELKKSYKKNGYLIISFSIFSVLYNTVGICSVLTLNIYNMLLGTPVILMGLVSLFLAFDSSYTRTHITNRIYLLKKEAE